MKKLFILAIAFCSSLLTMKAADKTELVDYVNPLVGSQSKISLSTGNTYPAIAMPWGMNFWMPQTGKMGDGWAYTYEAVTPALSLDKRLRSVCHHADNR